jgi:hypothetical protein
MYLKFLSGYQATLQKAAAGPEEMAALANAGGGMPGAEMGGEMPPEMAGAMGGAPGAEELAGLGAEGGEGGDAEAQLEQIAAALDEAGITPEELAAAVAEAQGGEVPTEDEGGEAQGEAGELGEEGAGEPEEDAGGGMEVPASRGKPVVKKAATKKASNKRALINVMRSWK